MTNDSIPEQLDWVHERAKCSLVEVFAVQVYAILILLLALLLGARYTRGADFAIVVGFYALAKIFEEADRPVFALGHIVSGHTLKHLAAATAGLWILRMLEKREPIASP